MQLRGRLRLHRLGFWERSSNTPGEVKMYVIDLENHFKNFEKGYKVLLGLLSFFSAFRLAQGRSERCTGESMLAMAACTNFASTNV